MNSTTNSSQQVPDTPGEHAAVTDVPPSSQALAEAAELQVLGRDDKPRPFKSLFGEPNATSRVVVVFIRHFFCGACQAYTHDLSTTFTPEVLSSHKTPTTFVLIGTGDPELIDEYVQLTESRFPIYTDPTGKLFDTLGMVRTAAVGNRTAYSPQRWIRHFFKGTFDALVNLPSGKTRKAGDGLRVGGEFVFEEVEGARTVTWCHRMRNHRDHTEIADLCRVLKFNV